MARRRSVELLVRTRGGTIAAVAAGALAGVGAALSLGRRRAAAA